jgi:putative Holliday junction resolvase
VGVAISDELGLIAQPLEFIPAEPLSALLNRIEDIVAAKQVEQIVIGMPRNMDGSYGPAAVKAQEFMESLRQAVPVPVRAWDERLTTAQAQRCLIEGNVRREKRKEKIDKTAAAILLQSYLDSLTR